MNEASLLTSNGIVIGRQTLTFNLKAIVSDAPARSFLKCIIAHTGYHSCARCVLRAESKNHRIVFNGNGSLSPLVKIDFDCINGFPLDYMLCVLLGVVKRILVFITKEPKICRLSNQQIQQISNNLLSLKLPSNFNRQPRSMESY